MPLRNLRGQGAKRKARANLPANAPFTISFLSFPLYAYNPFAPSLGFDRYAVSTVDLGAVKRRVCCPQ